MRTFDITIFSITRHPSVINLITNIVSSLLEALGCCNVALYYSDKYQNKINTDQIKSFILPVLDYSNVPQLVHRTATGSAVVGVTCLGDEVFVLRDDKAKADVYDVKTLTQL